MRDIGNAPYDVTVRTGKCFRTLPVLAPDTIFLDDCHKSANFVNLLIQTQLRPH